MDLQELFNGVAVVVDDEVNNTEANINNLIGQIKDKKIPILKYDEIPHMDTVKHFHGISFILLDWRLVKDGITNGDIEGGVHLPATLQNYAATKNIEFIKKIKEVCLCPIFIFTNEDVATIQDALANEGLYEEGNPSYILIESKANLSGKTKLFRKIEDWLKKTPSIYVLKEWECEYQKSKNKLFSEFQDLSPAWPRIMWENFKADGANESLELGDLISRNLHTRMSPFGFSEAILKKKKSQVNKNELRKVLEGERFLNEENLPGNCISPGDIFKIRSGYYINVRAACDLIPRKPDDDASLDDVELYLLKGQKISDDKIKEQFNSKYGIFMENHSQSLIFPLYNGNVIDFRFKELKIMKWAECKKKRIGRLLPPYINKVQQKYAHYMQRQGLPRLPADSVV